MDPARIRRATVADSAGLSELGARTFSETFAAQNKPDHMARFLAETYSPEIQAREVADPGSEILLAEIRDALVGYAHLHFGEAPECVRGPRPVELKRLYVDKAWHGRRVAPTLMEAVLEAARARGAQTLWLGVWEHNERAKAYYAKNGFTRVGAHTFMLGGDPQLDWILVRPL